MDNVNVAASREETYRNSLRKAFDALCALDDQLRNRGGDTPIEIAYDDYHRDLVDEAINSAVEALKL